MQQKQFENLLGGLPSKAMMLDEVQGRKLKQLKKDKTDSGKESARAFIEDHEQSIPEEMPIRVWNLVKKLRAKKWSETKIQNHIKKNFKITVV